MMRRYEFQFQEEIQLIAWTLAPRPEGHSGATSRRHAATFPLKVCPLAKTQYYHDGRRPKETPDVCGLLNLTGKNNVYRT